MPYRPIVALPLTGVTPAVIESDKPQFDWIDPAELCVEDIYQRDLSPKSLTMIRQIIANWNWAKIKPAICVRTGNRLVIIDGQHTAIAAVSHGGIPKIPVIIVDAKTVKERAAAFLSQNRDRLALTPMHMHFAAVAAGDEIAIAVAEACAKAKVIILPHPRGSLGKWKVGETVAVGIISRIIAKIGVFQGARVMKVLVDAKRAPISAHEIAAVHELMFDPKYKNGAGGGQARFIRSGDNHSLQNNGGMARIGMEAHRDRHSSAPSNCRRLVQSPIEGSLMPDFEARNKLLETENEALRDRISELEAMLGMSFDSPAFLALTGKEAVVFGVLMKRNSVSKRMLMDALYGGRPDGDAAEEKIVDVFVCKLRAKLKPYGVDIETNWGQGYFMTAPMKSKANEIMRERAAA